MDWWIKGFSPLGYNKESVVSLFVQCSEVSLVYFHSFSIFNSSQTFHLPHKLRRNIPFLKIYPSNQPSTTRFFSRSHFYIQYFVRNAIFFLFVSAHFICVLCVWERERDCVHVFFYVCTSSCTFHYFYLHRCINIHLK